MKPSSLIEPAELPVGPLLNEVAQLMRREFDRRLRVAGIRLTRAQWMILYHVQRSEGASQSQIAEALDLERMTVGRHVMRLSAAGWLARKTDGADGRIYRLYLRRKAEEMLQRLEPLLEQLRRDYLSGLTRERRAALFEDLQRIRQNILRRPDRARKLKTS